LLSWDIGLLVCHVFDHADEVGGTIAAMPRPRRLALRLTIALAVTTCRPIIWSGVPASGSVTCLVGVVGAFGDGIHAVAKRGQMTGGPGDSLDEESRRGTGGISERIRASDAYAPERTVWLPTARFEDEARA